MNEKIAKFKELVEKYFGLDIFEYNHDYVGHNKLFYKHIEDNTLYLLDDCDECDCCSLHIIKLMTPEELLERLSKSETCNYYLIGKAFMASKGKIPMDELIMEIIDDGETNVFDFYKDNNYYNCGTTFNYDTGHSEFEF